MDGIPGILVSGLWVFLRHLWSLLSRVTFRPRRKVRWERERRRDGDSEWERATYELDE